MPELILSLISHFTIASDGREYLRVRSVNLRAGDTGVEVEQASSSVHTTVSWLGGFGLSLGCHASSTPFLSL
jgi:hypothetical protein